MKKIYYESPTVEVVDVRVEGGFGVSQGQANAGVFGYDETIQEMESTDTY